MKLGEIGIWRLRHHGPDGLEELEALGYGTFWLGASPGTDDVRPYLERTSTMTIATGILNVWQHEPAAVATGHAELTRDFPGRFLLGVGIGHPEATSDYTRPLARPRGRALARRAHLLRPARAHPLRARADRT
jgi:alkanesulfonate monooxygenase SsuD/methylene tetrahydromethanopterin reductase-like flavin-dependent oxidoreductase (luciferase family)